MEFVDDIKDTIDTTEKKNDKVGAKGFSLVAQIVAALWVGLWSAFKFITACKTSQLQDVAMTDIIVSAFAIAGCFSPVYLSIILDKIKGKV